MPVVLFPSSPLSGSTPPLDEELRDALLAQGSVADHLLGGPDCNLLAMQKDARLQEDAGDQGACDRLVNGL